MHEALATGRLTVAVLGAQALVFAAEAPEESPAILGTDGRVCAFYERDIRRCRVHNVLGHAALPLSCRQFPRVTVLDPGGAAVTLSHYCPTAAALLDTHAPTTVVRHPAAFPADGEYVGLDARDALPPLLAPGLLMDWKSWWQFEALAVAHLASDTVPLDQALRHLATTVEVLRRWRPTGGTLGHAVERAFSDPPPGDTPLTIPAPALLLDAVLEAVPADLRPRTLERTPPPAEHVRRRFVAAHAFANWTAHLGGGLRSWLRSVQAADALIELGLGVRQTDLLLRHLAEPHVLAERWSGAEAE